MEVNDEGSRSPEVKGSFDWKEHPLMVAVGTSVATTLIIVTLFTEIVLPVHLAKADLEISRLGSELDSAKLQLTKVSKELEESQDELKGAESLRDDLTSLLLLERTESMFRPGVPYPTGLGLVRIGSDISEIKKWNVGVIDEKESLENDYVVVNIENSPIGRATYFLEKGQRRISHISFALNYSAAAKSGLLHRELIEAFGEPDSNPKPSLFRWKVNEEESVFEVTAVSFMVTRNSQVPAYWPYEDES